MFRDITKSEPAPAPEKKEADTARPLVGKEVYHVGDDRFTYDEAAAVCAAYGGEMATQEQVEEAYQDGAEWCGYGWTIGGLALFPTQRATWELLQREIDPQKRTICGRPGVNGGYFDPSLKFGVNCYGQKPPGKVTLPLAPPGKDMASFNEMVARFKAQIQDFFQNPFNRTTWAQKPDILAYGTQFKQDIGKLGESEAGDATTADGKVKSRYVFKAVENPSVATASTAATTASDVPPTTAAALLPLTEKTGWHKVFGDLNDAMFGATAAAPVDTKPKPPSTLSTIPPPPGSDTKAIRNAIDAAKQTLTSK
jgi:hypothetical protein